MKSFVKLGCSDLLDAWRLMLSMFDDVISYFCQMSMETEVRVKTEVRVTTLPTDSELRMRTKQNEMESTIEKGHRTRRAEPDAR